jgi:predicted lipoprotein with Yx(FWY)xxD motif
MKPTQHRRTNRRVPIARLAGAMVAVGGLAASFAIAGPAGAATITTVSTTKSTQFGTILVSGKTVYTLKASKTPCTAACLAVWPQVLLPKGMAKPHAKGGVNAAKLGTIKRSGGALQVTYAGKPLYYFSGDSSAGQVNGNITDSWGKWSVVTTSGTPAPSSSGSSSGGSSAGTGGASF